MNARAYYNENDPFAAQWLRNLIAGGHIARGDVDERSIVDVRPSDLAGYTQCHFFSGIGGWSLALRLAGWPDDRPVWTGSCPCQPFSAAGKGGGFADERHLWPSWFHLIRECGPSVVFGEQVASKDGLGWLDLVQADLEGSGYACGAVDLCAAGIGAPHIRQRQWWIGERLADAHDTRLEIGRGGPDQIHGPERWEAAERSSGLRCVDGRLADAPRERWDRSANSSWAPRNASTEVHCDIGWLANRHGHRCAEDGQCEPSTGNDGLVGDSAFSWLADASGEGRRPERPHGDAADGTEALLSGQAEPGRCGAAHRPGPTNGLWRDADWLFCRDGKWRPVEPGTFPLAHGVHGRVGRLRAYGNAIVPQVAAEFIRAYLECHQQPGAAP